jgi:hypothetical protein
MLIIQACPWVLKKCLGMLHDLPQLGSPNSRKRLARRAAHNNVHGTPGLLLRSKLRNQLAGADPCYISRLGIHLKLPLIQPSMKIEGMGAYCVRVDFHRTNNFSARKLAAERNTAASAEQVKDSGTLAIAQSGEFLFNQQPRFIGHFNHRKEFRS